VVKRVNYDIFETEVYEQVPLIKAFYELELNPWIFNKLQTVDALRILLSFLLDTPYPHIVIKPKIKGDKCDLFNAIKDGLKFLGTVDVEDNILVLRHITRIHKLILSHSYQLPQEIYCFEDILSIDGSPEFSSLLNQFINSTEKDHDRVVCALNQKWTNTLDNFFKIQIAKEIFGNN
jgi:hypothetical protein